MSIPVSPEFLYDRQPNFGKQSMAAMAALTGGREVLDIRELFDRTQVSRAAKPMIYPLLIALMVCLLLEIAEPRFGLLAYLKQNARP